MRGGTLPASPQSFEPGPLAHAGGPGSFERVEAQRRRSRAAVVHRYVLDLPYERIAELIGGSADAARANVSQAMRTLRGEVMRR